MSAILARIRTWADELNANSRWTLALNQTFDAIGFTEEFISRARTAGQYVPLHVKDSVWGMIEVDTTSVVLLNCPLLQRLRSISQLGFTFLTYPTARHTRFEHSLGVYYVVSRLIESFEATANSDTNKNGRPGILWDELKDAPKVPNGVACDELGGVPVLHIDIADGESLRFGLDAHKLDDYLESATAFIAKHIAYGCVLVHCGAGISRSAAVVIAYLCRYAGMSYSEALGFVKTERPQVAPADDFAIAIKNWLRLDRLAEKGPRQGGLNGAGW